MLPHAGFAGSLSRARPQRQQRLEQRLVHPHACNTARRPPGHRCVRVLDGDPLPGRDEGRGREVALRSRNKSRARGSQSSVVFRRVLQRGLLARAGSFPAIHRIGSCLRMSPARAGPSSCIQAGARRAGEGAAPRAGNPPSATAVRMREARTPRTAFLRGESSPRLCERYNHRRGARAPRLSWRVGSVSLHSASRGSGSP